MEVTNAVKLRDLPEPVEVKVKSEKIAGASNCRVARNYPAGKMRPCISGVIDSGVRLEGGDGHMMRIAIAAEALHCGLSEEKTTILFRNQRDFDEQETIKNIRYIWDNNYCRVGCEKLRDQCGSFVCDYCKDCSFSKQEV